MKDLGAQVFEGGGVAVRHHAAERSHRPAVEPCRHAARTAHAPDTKVRRPPVESGVP